MSLPSSYRLSRWGAHIRIRDDMTCFFCACDCLKGSQVREMRELFDLQYQAGELEGFERDALKLAVYEAQGEAHHIMPKSLYPGAALVLANGVCACHKCHRQFVHATWTSWGIYKGILKAYNRRKVVSEYNETNQRSM